MKYDYNKILLRTTEGLKIVAAGEVMLTDPTYIRWEFLPPAEELVKRLNEAKNPEIKDYVGNTGECK